MTPNGRNGKELTWSWAYSTGHPASDQKLEAAAHAAWPYAYLCAWTHLNDHDAAVDLMDHAVHNAFRYLARHSDTTEQKLTARIKSVIRRRARQLAAKRGRELPSGSMRDMERMHVGHSDAEQRAYAAEVIARLSPTARSIFDWRLLGYSWREIGEKLEMDYSALRRAYFRELELVLRSLSSSGDSQKCG
jgi:DNA-directed RNA polymerase specialized sigma24 family protein